jgi:hypothetical protein
MRRFLPLLFALALLAGTLAPQAEAAFCNTTGFPHCDSFDGTPCGPLNPTYQRCIGNANYCEWGACSCNGSFYNCAW